MAEQSEWADVVPLRREQDMTDEERLLHTAPRPPFCRHQRFQLEGESRRVYCGDCGREVSAFDALDVLAHDVERYINQRKEAQRRARVAAEAVEEAERLAKNAKAKHRRAVMRAPMCSCEGKLKLVASQHVGPWCPACGGRR